MKINERMTSPPLPRLALGERLRYLPAAELGAQRGEPLAELGVAAHVHARRRGAAGGAAYAAEYTFVEDSPVTKARALNEGLGQLSRGR